MPVGDTNLTGFLSVINKKLEPLSMSIVKGKEEDTGHTYYALVSMCSQICGNEDFQIFATHLYSAKQKM